MEEEKDFVVLKWVVYDLPGIEKEHSMPPMGEVGARVTITSLKSWDEAAFLSALALIELNRQGWLPSALSGVLPVNHFHAVGFVFNLLLIIEVISLIFSLVHSVSESVGKQFEILSLILLRSTFKEFVHFSEPIHWTRLSEPIYHILSDAVGALIIFIILGFYYKLQKHQPLFCDEQEKNRFILSKKALALLLLTVFTVIGFVFLFDFLDGRATFDFFAIFYTILIFSDILIVLISLRYNYNYFTLFRNSGFALTTVVIRLALTAPPYINVIFGISAALFGIGLTLAYNVMAPDANIVNSEAEKK
jgi:hypothetical protein